MFRGIFVMYYVCDEGFIARVDEAPYFLLLANELEKVEIAAERLLNVYLLEKNPTKH